MSINFISIIRPPKLCISYWEKTLFVNNKKLPTLVQWSVYLTTAAIIFLNLRIISFTHSKPKRRSFSNPDINWSSRTCQSFKQLSSAAKRLIIFHRLCSMHRSSTLWPFELRASKDAPALRRNLKTSGWSEVTDRRRGVHLSAVCSSIIDGISLMAFSVLEMFSRLKWFKC